ncbi:MAG: LPS export ABC transporter permease LptG [Rhodospirillaceae bacterium]|nr:LPS export ABC transporter permease LptG [Rhodospirillaceae bacterium]
MILSRYLMRAFLARFVGLLLGLVLFLQTLDLLANANDVLAGGGAPLDSLLRYVALRVPSLIETVAPLAALLGALTALVTMAKNSEVLAMRAAGRSVLSLVGGLVAVGSALAIMLFLFSEIVVVRTNGALEDWRDAGFRAEPVATADEGENSWLMEDDTIVRVGHVIHGGTELMNVRLLKQGGDTEILDIIDIDRAVWNTDHWDTTGMRRVGGTALNEPTPLEWKTSLRPEHFMRFASHPNELSLNALQEYVGNVAIGSRPQYFYDTWFHQKIAGPIVLALMPLLAAIAAFSHHRQGSAVITIVWGITLGFLFIVIDNMILAMGQFGSLPPFMAAWLPLILFATLGVWIVFSFENTGART